MNNLLSYCGLVDASASASEKDLPVTPINKMKPNLNKFLFSTTRPQDMWPLGVRTLQISGSELDLKFSRYSDTWILHGFWVFQPHAERFHNTGFFRNQKPLNSRPLCIKFYQ